jgi:hypothetical protein
LFKRLDRLGILLGMLRPRADAREAELLHDAPEAHFRQIDAEAIPNDALQVDAAPAHHSVRLRVGSVLDELLQHLLLLVRQARSSPGRLDVDQPVRPMLVEPVRPVPQGLPVHAADPGRLGAAHAVQHCRQGQQPTSLRAGLRKPRKLP